MKQTEENNNLIQTMEDFYEAHPQLLNPKDGRKVSFFNRTDLWAELTGVLRLSSHHTATTKRVVPPGRNIDWVFGGNLGIALVVITRRDKSLFKTWSESWWSKVTILFAIESWNSKKASVIYKSQSRSSGWSRKAKDPGFPWYTIATYLAKFSLDEPGSKNATRPNEKDKKTKLSSQTRSVKIALRTSPHFKIVLWYWVS